MLQVRHLIKDRPAPLILKGGQSVVEAARYLKKHRIGGAPVVEDGRLVGFCSERDLVFRVIAAGLDALRTTVEDIMTAEVVTAGPDDSVEECEQKLRKAHCRHLPIVEGGKVIACLSLRDFLQSDLRACELELNHLKEYIRGAQ